MPSSTAARQPVIKVEKWGICLNTADDHTGGGMSWMPHEEPDGRQEWNLTEVTAFYMISQVRPIRTAASGTKWSWICKVGLLPIFEKKMKNWICHWVGKVELDLVRTPMMAFLYVYGNYICIFIIVLTHPMDPWTNRLYGTRMEVPIQLTGAY